MVIAAPDVRDMCPPEAIEGKWIEVDFVPEKLVIGALEARPTGKVARRADLMSAPVFEVRRPRDWRSAES